MFHRDPVSTHISIAWHGRYLYRAAAYRSGDRMCLPDRVYQENTQYVNAIRNLIEREWERKSGMRWSEWVECLRRMGRL